MYCWHALLLPVLIKCILHTLTPTCKRRMDKNDKQAQKNYWQMPQQVLQLLATVATRHHHLAIITSSSQSSANSVVMWRRLHAVCATLKHGYSDGSLTWNTISYRHALSETQLQHGPLEFRIMFHVRNMKRYTIRKKIPTPNGGELHEIFTECCAADSLEYDEVLKAGGCIQAWEERCWQLCRLW